MWFYLPKSASPSVQAAAFIRWQQDMRFALSRLPTASGAWIWQPPRPLMNRDLGNLFDWGWTT